MSTSSDNDTIRAEITINAPAERVFAALTDPEERLKWWGQGQYRSTQLESDLRPGGKWLQRGIGGDGGTFSVRGEYRAVEPPRLLVFTWNPSWEQGAAESLVRFELEEKNGVTTVRLSHSGLVSESARAHHRGWPQVLAWLKAHAEGRAS